MGMTRIDDTSPAEAAADWLVRLQADDASEADWMAFETWLAASPENWAAYDKLERLSVEVEARADEVRAALRTDSPSVFDRVARAVWAVAGVAAGAEGYVVNDQADHVRRIGPPRGMARATTWAMAGVAAAAAGVALWMFMPGAAPLQVFDAAKGQVREVALADGTHVTLDTGSRIEVRLERHARRVTMGEGQAAFDVAKDANRPFLITVGDRTVKVVGTEFDVLNRDRQLSVTVSRGVVEVAPTDGPRDGAVRLVRGNRLEHMIGSSAQRIDVVARPEDDFAWRKLRLIYDNAPLEQVVADLNRYFPRPVALDADAKALKFSGVLVVADEDAVLGRLGELLPVAADRSASTVVLHRRTARD